MLSRAVASCALVFSLLGCQTTPNPPMFERFNMAATPEAKDYPGVGGVVLLSRGTLSFFVEPELKIPVVKLRVYHRTKVLRPELMSLKRILVPYDPGTVVVDLVAQVVPESGEATFIKDIYDIDLEDGRRAKAFKPEGAAEGSVIEYTYDLFFRDLRFVPAWAFQEELPVVRSEYAVNVPPGFQVDFRFTVAGEVSDRAPERFDVDGGTRLSWSLADLPALFPEVARPADARLSPRALVGFVGATIQGKRFDGFRGWDDVKKWFFEERIKDFAKLRPEQIGEAARVAGDAPTDEKALKLLEIVARDLPWPKGPRVPLYRADIQAAQATLDKKEGTMTSRGLLLTALCRAAGLEAYPGFFAYRDDALLLPDFPAPRDIDGIVVVIPRPGGPLFLDPSSLTASADVPPPRVQGTRVIALRDDVADVLIVPSSLPKDSRAQVQYDLKVDKKGTAIGKLDAKLTGALAADLRGQLLGKDAADYPKIVSRYLASIGAGLPLESTDLADLTVLRRPLLIRGNIDVPGFLSSNNEPEVMLRLGKVLHRFAEEDLAPRRRQPLLLGAPHQAEVTATIILPDDHKPESTPPPVEQAWPGGTHRLEARQETKTRIAIKSALEMTAVEISPAQYPAYFSALENLEHQLQGEIIIQRPVQKTYEY
ncbi:MAG: DUF3857 domain-containing protein [Myxococcota bacterium]